MVSMDNANGFPCRGFYRCESRKPATIFSLVVGDVPANVIVFLQHTRYQQVSVPEIRLFRAGDDKLKLLRLLIKGQ